MTDHNIPTGPGAEQQPRRWHAIRVHQADSSFHDDGIQGADRADSMANAYRNWITDTPHRPAAWVEYIDPAELAAAALIAACLDGDLGPRVRDRANGALTCATEHGYKRDEARVLDTLREYLDDPAHDTSDVGDARAADTNPARADPTGEVWVVHRPEQLDGIYVFADEHRARRYAELHPSAGWSRETVMNDSAAGQFLIDDTAEDDAEDGTGPVRGERPGAAGAQA